MVGARGARGAHERGAHERGIRAEDDKRVVVRLPKNPNVVRHWSNLFVSWCPGPGCVPIRPHVSSLSGLSSG